MEVARKAKNKTERASISELKYLCETKTRTIFLKYHCLLTELPFRYIKMQDISHYMNSEIFFYSTNNFGSS